MTELRKRERERERERERDAVCSMYKDSMQQPKRLLVLKFQCPSYRAGTTVERATAPTADQAVERSQRRSDGEGDPLSSIPA